VLALPLEPGYSTTGILEQILSRNTTSRNTTSRNTTSRNTSSTAV